MRSVPPPVRPREELERLRRSVVMLQPGSLAMSREDVLGLLHELGEVRGQLNRLREGLRALLREDD